MTDKTRCPVCGGNAMEIFLRRPDVPVHQNYLCPDFASALAIPRGDLEMACCPDCGFVRNVAFDPSRLDYSEGYENTQGCSSCFADYMEGLAWKVLAAQKGTNPLDVVEIGCGKGDFLRLLTTLSEGRVRARGFDTSHVGPDVALDGQVRFFRRYYQPELDEPAARVMVCRHVVEHVPDPAALLAAMALGLECTPDARAYLETPLVEWILRGRVFWDFFYEHCSLFSVSSLSRLCREAGLGRTRASLTFGGQYLWLEAARGRSEAPTDGTALFALARDYGQDEARRLSTWQQRLADLSSRGRIAVWGAGAKGVTFVNLLDPRQELLDCVVDLNPRKQGHFLPGSGHPIIGIDALLQRGVTTAIVMNPNYMNENERLLEQAGIPITLIPG